MRAYFDIETGGLEPRKHKVWVMSYTTDQSDDARTLKLFVPYGQIHDEGRLLLDIQRELRGFSEIVSWNGWKFDIPFINYRSRKYGLPALRHDLHVDLGIVTKRRYGLRKWTQESIMAHYGIEPNTKPFQEGIWYEAGFGLPSAQDYIVDHCEQDVKGLKRLYHSIMLEDSHAIGPAA